MASDLGPDSSNQVLAALFSEVISLVDEYVDKTTELPAVQRRVDSDPKLSNRSMRGREDAWRQVAQAVGSTGTAGRTLIVLTGGAGSGKSHLLREVLDAARRGGCVTVDGHGWRPAAATAGEDTRVRRLAPSASTGLALVVWDDDATLEPGFVRMWTRTADLPVVWVVARRPGDRSGSLFEADADVTVSIDLPPLSRAAVAGLVADLLGRPAAPELLDLVGAASGSPGAVVELVEGLLAENRLRLTDHAARLVRPDLPARTRQRIQDGLGQVSPTARHLIQVAAASRGACELTDLARLMRRAPVSLLPAVEEALSSGLLVGLGDRIAFPHELVRAEIERSLPASVLRSLSGFAARGPTSAPERGSEPEAMLKELTPRQRQIVELVLKALTDQQIANRLYLSPHTVNYHLRRIYQRLGISSRLQLVNQLTNRSPQ